MSNKDREAADTAARVAFNAVAVWCDPFSAIDAVSNAAYVFFLSSRASGVRYERMANKLIELLENAPMLHDTQSAHCKRIANKLGDLINKQGSIVDNIDNAVRPVMDNSDKMKFLIFYQDSVKTLMESIEKHVNLLRDELSVVKALFKNNPSDDISVN